jgi:hypothetical protein
MPETPLLTYLRIQRASDRDMLRALQAASVSVRAELLDLRQSSRPGERVRREQALRTQVAIERELTTFYARAGLIVEARAAEAAAAGAETILRESEGLLKKVLSAEDYDYLSRSAQASASQSLEALRQRVSGSSYVPLSEQVYQTHALSTGQVDTIINTALARGSSAAELARNVRDFINPSTPGGVRYASLRLGRTELNNAFHAAQIAQAQEEPWTTGLLWNLSGSHPTPDECNDYAGKIYDPEDVPVKPHPNCLCYTTPDTLDEEAFINGFMSGRFDAYLDRMGAGIAPGGERLA